MEQIPLHDANGLCNTEKRVEVHWFLQKDPRF